MAQQESSNRFGQPGLGSIFSTLAARSTRPRYAFLVLQLVAEAAGDDGTAGPLVVTQQGPMGLRDWLSTQLMPVSERNVRRAGLRARVVQTLANTLSGDSARDEQTITDAVEDQVLAVGRANVSRAISDLVKAGLLRRHYAGYATDHANRGGGRQAVYIIEVATLLALGKKVEQTRSAPIRLQGDLFAA